MPHAELAPSQHAVVMGHATVMDRVMDRSSPRRCPLRPSTVVRATAVTAACITCLSGVMWLGAGVGLGAAGLSTPQSPRALSSKAQHIARDSGREPDSAEQLYQSALRRRTEARVPSPITTPTSWLVAQPLLNLKLCIFRLSSGLNLHFA